MRLGIYQDDLAVALQEADTVYFYQPEQLNWSLAKVADVLPNAKIYQDINVLIQSLIDVATDESHILIMSNGDFQNLHQRLLDALNSSV